MLEPRKLMPFSIEYCNAPIAVMTEITEKTPMVMPSIVSAERSLFAPRDENPILTLPQNNMDPYSYQGAATGSSREADHAGAKPDTIPVIGETMTLAMTNPKLK